MNSTTGWPCVARPGNCIHDACRPDDDTVSALVSRINTVDAAPDGVTPDQWRRGIALIAAASMTQQYGSTPEYSITIARKFEQWIREGDS